MWLESIPSTSRWLQEQIASGIPHGTWVAAAHQTQGQGRHGRLWDSGEGNLYWSGWFQKPALDRITWFPLVVGWRVREILLRDLKREQPGCDFATRLKLKWPNDLLLDGAKCAGILCEAQKDGIVVGIGINLRTPPTVAGRSVTSLESKLPAREWAEKVAEELFSAPDALNQDASHFGPTWLADSAHPVGSSVRFGPTHEEGTILRIGAFGELIVDTASRGEVSLWAEEIETKIVVPQRPSIRDGV